VGRFSNLPSNNPNVTMEEAEEQVAGLDRTAFENLIVSMEKSFYNIVDLSATSIRKLSAYALPEDDIRKEVGAGWIGQHAADIAVWAGQEGSREDLRPEDDPDTMDKFASLVGTTVPYMAAAMAGGYAGAAVGGVGAAATGVAGLTGLGAKLGAGLASFSIMREEAYRNAIDTGADEDTANIEANIVGGVNALIEVAQVGSVLRTTKTGGVLLKSIATSARNKSWEKVIQAGGKFGMRIVRNAAEEALEEALQGTTSEIVPRLLRGKPIEEGFAERRLAEAGAGALIGGFFAGIGTLADASMKKGTSLVPWIDEIENEGGPVDTPAQQDVEIDETAPGPDGLTKAQKADMVIEGKEIDPGVQYEAETGADIDSSISRFDEAFKKIDVAEIRKITEIERTQERGKRTAAAEAEKTRVWNETLDPEAANRAAKAMIRGEMPKSVYVPMSEDTFSAQDWKNLKVKVLHSDLQTFESMNAMSAVSQLEQGLIPPPAELKLLSRALGIDAGIQNLLLAEDIATTPAILRYFREVINLPRTLLATADNSLLGRQGIFGAFAHPVKWSEALVKSYKAMFSPEYAEMSKKELATNKYARLRKSTSLFESELEGPLTSREESHLSLVATNIPIMGAVVRASERAAAVGMNSLRASIFDAQAEAWQGQGVPKRDYNTYAQMINHATGRGTGKFLDKFGPYLNIGFFAPRYSWSRFQLIGDSVKALTDIATGNASPASKVLAKELVSFVAAGMTILFLAHLAGAKVERDPRSSDFGKIQMGRTRVDIWGGGQQIARTAAQLFTAQGKSTKTGEIYTKDRLEVFGRFIQSKLSPPAGLTVEMLTGKDFLGEPIPDRVKTKEGFIEYALEKITPLVIQDTVEAYRTEGMKTAAAALPMAFHGVGVQTFERTSMDDLTDLRDHYAIDVFGRKWEELGPRAQNALREYKPQIEEQERIAQFDRRNIAFDATRQREAGQLVERSLGKNIRKEMDRIGVTVGGISRTLNRNWRLSSDRYSEYQKETSKLINSVLSRIVDTPGYNNMDDQRKAALLDYVIRESKRAARNKIVMTANIKDLREVKRNGTG